MKIVAISDFDSGFSASKIIPKIKKEKPDLIIAHGDLCYGDKIRDILFSNWSEIKFGGKNWFDFIPKKQARALVKKSLDQGERVIRNLAALNTPILVVYGNHEAWDYKEKEDLGHYRRRFDRIIKKYKNIKSLEFASKEIAGINFVGYGNFNSGPEYQRTNYFGVRILLKQYKNLFSKKMPNVLVTHNVPYGTKLGIIDNPKSPNNGAQVGSKYTRKLIRRYKPILCISGHMHENQGQVKLGKTVCIDTGMGSKAQYAVINIKNHKIPKIRFRR